MTDPIRAALQRLINAVLDGLAHDDHPMGWARVDDAIAAARAALAQPEPEAMGPTDQELADAFAEGCRDGGKAGEPPFLGGARAVLARYGRPALDAAPLKGPSLEEVEDLCEEHCFNVEGYESIECLQGLLNDALARWGRPAPPARAALAAAPEGTPLPLTISCLLHPAYEPGDARADGAQLVDLQWWHPIMGCDSLQVVVDNARAALKAASEETPSDDELTMTYAYAVAAAVDNKRGPFNKEDAEAAQLAGLRAVIARWARPAPAPADGEVEELVARLGWIAAQCGDVGWPDDSAAVERAAALLRQLTSNEPLDLDALLSPEGAYEPGTGQEDGAQLCTGHHGDNPQWWAPVYGCDTLENLLDRIRSRILPYMRPPIAGIDVPGGDGDYGGIQELCDAEGVDVRIGAPLLKRAREAWFPTTPPVLAAGEVGELVAWLERTGEDTIRPSDLAEHQRYKRTAALLRQLSAAQAPQPVAVAGEEYHDDLGPVLWWRFPVEEAPYVGTPTDSDWPGYHTHFTPLPATPALPATTEIQP